MSTSFKLQEGDIVHVEGKAYPFIVSCVVNEFAFITGLGDTVDEQNTKIVNYSECYGYRDGAMNRVFRVNAHPEYIENKRALYNSIKIQTIEKVLAESLIVKHGLFAREDLEEILNGKPYMVGGYEITVRAFGSDLDDYPILVSYSKCGNVFYEWMAVDLFRFAQPHEILDPYCEPAADDMDLVSLHDLISVTRTINKEQPAKPQTLTNLALYPDENGNMWLVGGTPDNFHATNVKTKETRIFEDENGLLTTGDQLQLDGRQLASVKHESIEDITLRKGDVVQLVEDNQVYTGVVIDDNYNDVTPILVVYGYGLVTHYTAKGYSDYFERRRAITYRLGHFEYFEKI